MTVTHTDKQHSDERALNAFHSHYEKVNYGASGDTDSLWIDTRCAIGVTAQVEVLNAASIKWRGTNQREDPNETAPAAAEIEDIATATGIVAQPSASAIGYVGGTALPRWVQLQRVTPTDVGTVHVNVRGSL